MNNDFQYILFDLDGTLTDSGEGITKAAQYALKHFGIEVEDLNDLRKFVGPPLRDSYKNFYDFDDEKAEIGITKFREYYTDKGIYENKVYDGVEETLKALKDNGKKLIVATSKPEVHAKVVLDHFDLAKYFDFIGGADLEETRVRKSDVIKYSMENVGIDDLSKVIMVGDREHDIIGAKENNIKSIGVLYGYGDVVELTQARADYVVEKPQDIIDIVVK
ncbi:HAD family hydrolase [uncultured Clostridium sp.]|uniref:HAD family hydrolase n=1 Tax=uncultured Clostridium sp. TaxID=59620 RepID=UPI0025CD519B|nr:HAD family hydrolase [uncultured Clostridium sp.]